jgi:hypothetical protein
MFNLLSRILFSGAENSLARNRSRRTRTDKSGRLAALAKFRQAKATGTKYVIEVGHSYQSCQYSPKIFSYNAMLIFGWVVKK